MPKYRLYRKDNTFEDIEASGTYVFYPKTHQVYLPSIRVKIKSVYKVEVLDNAVSEEKEKKTKSKKN